LYNNNNQSLVTSFITADTVPPSCKLTGVDEIENPICTSVSLPSKFLNKQFAMVFKERILNGSTTGTAAEKTAALKNAVQISVDGGAYGALATKDNIRLIKNTLQVNFSSARAVGKTYKIKISAEALQDLTGNKVGEIVSDVFQVDTGGPKLR
jgi:hypothetical protein